MNLPVHIDPLSYAGGILDTVGVFKLRTRCTTCKMQTCPCGSPRMEAHSAEVSASTNSDLTSLLIYVLGGRASDRGWRVPAFQQQRVCQDIMPYLRLKGDLCARVFRFRASQPRRAIGKKMPVEITKLRIELARRQNG